MRNYKKFLILLIFIFCVSCISARLQMPAYDSGWVNVSVGETKTFTHNIGGNVDNYLVDVIAKDGFGINQINFGTRQLAYGVAGYRWQNLTTSEIKVWRGVEDISAPLIKVRIWDYTIGDVPEEGILEGPYLYPLIEENKENITGLREQVEEKMDSQTTYQLVGFGGLGLVFLFLFWKLFIEY